MHDYQVGQVYPYIILLIGDMWAVAHMSALDKILYRSKSIDECFNKAMEFKVREGYDSNSEETTRLISSGENVG